MQLCWSFDHVSCRLSLHLILLRWILSVIMQAFTIHSQLIVKMCPHKISNCNLNKCNLFEQNFSNFYNVFISLLFLGWWTAFWRFFGRVIGLSGRGRRPTQPGQIHLVPSHTQPTGGGSQWKENGKYCPKKGWFRGVIFTDSTQQVSTRKKILYTAMRRDTVGPG